jgi:transcriptional regulator with XRE-family HTH domain
MHPDKEDFKRLIEIMGWSQSEAARRLKKTPSAISHLVNPDHPNRPTQTTLLLLKHIIALERPDLTNAQAHESKKAPTRPKPDARRLNSKEWKMMKGLRKLPATDQEMVYAVIKRLLRGTSRNGEKTRQ